MDCWESWACCSCRPPLGPYQFLGAGAEWGLWLLVMLAGLLLGAGVAGLLAARLVREEGGPR